MIRLRILALALGLPATVVAAAAVAWFGKPAPTVKPDVPALNAASSASSLIAITLMAYDVFSKPPQVDAITTAADGSHTLTYTVFVDGQPATLWKVKVTPHGIPLKPVCLSCGDVDKSSRYAP